jgi:hypothetical protein
MKKTLIAFAATALFALSGASVMAASHVGAPMAAPAPAGATTAAELSGTKKDAKAMKKQAAADYKAAKKACKPMKGAEEKACKKEAKATYEKAKAEAHGVHEMAEAKTPKDKAEVVNDVDKKKAKADAKAMK